MRSTRILSIFSAVASMLLSPSASADVTVYNSKMEFELAAGLIKVNDLNSISPGTLFGTTPTEIGDFSISFEPIRDPELSPVIAGIFRTGPTSSVESVDGTNYGYSSGRDVDGAGEIFFDFSHPIVAFGFDTGGLNQGVPAVLGGLRGPNDFSFGGLSFFFESGGVSEFWGVISDEPFDRVFIGPNVNYAFTFDNVSYTEVPESSNLVTFKFEGPIGGNAGTSIAGEVTFDSSVSGIDVRGVHDEGDRLAYSGAVQSLSFTTNEGISRSLSGGDIQLFNDYQPCLGRQRGICILRGEPEPDRLHFSFSTIGTPNDLQLITSGIDETFLNSGELPQAMPVEGYGRTDFFFDEGDSVDPGFLTISSNDITIVTNVPQPIPTKLYTDIASLDDLNGDGVGETAVLSEQLVTILDGATGSWLTAHKFFWGHWQVHAIATLDSNLDGSLEVAALGQEEETRRIVVEIQDIASRKKIGRHRFFAYEGLTAISFTIGDVNFDGSPDVGVMALRADGRVVVEYRDAVTGSRLPDWVKGRIWLPRN